MKNIKFRAWAHGVDTMTFFDNVIVATGELSEGKAWGMFFPSANGKVYLGGYSNPMQFIGICDKHGKEIYEGDVVEWLVNGDVRRKGIVEYVEDSGGYDLKNFSDEYHVCNDWLRGEYEILGNIHENPELLTQ